jgi:type IV pilus assembly protein PilM
MARGGVYSKIVQSDVAKGGDALALELKTYVNNAIASLTGKRVTPLIGIDISSSSVKLVELSEGSNNEIRLERFASEPLPRGAMNDDNIENIDQVSEAIRRVVLKSGTKIKNISLGMPPGAVITKKITLPGGGSEEALEMQVESEASQYIPFALDEVRLDFCVIGPAPNSPDEIEVMLAASRKEKIEDRIAVAESSGLKAVVMDINSYAARSAVARLIAQSENGGRDKVIALIQIGTKVTYVSIFLNEQTVYEREQAFGGSQLTQEIVRAYGLSFEEAEAKKKSGDLPADYVDDILNPFLESAALEVTRAIQFFFTSTPYARIDQIYLAGGCVGLPGLLEEVANRTNVPTEIISPFDGMELAPGIKEKQLQNEAPSLLVACGLAMRRFD